MVIRYSLVLGVVLFLIGFLPPLLYLSARGDFRPGRPPASQCQRIFQIVLSEAGTRMIPPKVSFLRVVRATRWLHSICDSDNMQPNDCI